MMGTPSGLGLVTSYGIGKLGNSATESYVGRLHCTGREDGRELFGGFVEHAGHDVLVAAGHF
jgi:hypothetical protein